MKRSVLGLLLTLSCAAAYGQVGTSTTNCFAGVAGDFHCTTTQIAPPPPPPPMPVYQAPQPVVVPNAAQLQLQQQLLMQQQQIRIFEQRQELDAQQQVVSAPKAAPDNTDLKAAYCTGVVEAQLRVFRPASTNTATSSGLREQQTAKLQRLRAYINPRLQTLDPAPLLAARAQGMADWPLGEKQKTQCFVECFQGEGDHSHCAAQCDGAGEASQHLKICEKLSFMPY
ncbi:hypothetical protein [Dyella silvae]|uniref:hypothetical protein n=1 Tax=Dyella silvae TaxID=2994424 RepID=UPI0022653820|nr:hypothetical protein [Dyella silvae]